MKCYILQILIAIDQVINAVLFGWADESLSSRSYRLSRRGITWPKKIINGLFFWQRDHCKQAYVSERTGRQLPPEMRTNLNEIKD